MLTGKEDRRLGQGKELGFTCRGQQRAQEPEDSARNNQARNKQKATV